MFREDLARLRDLLREPEYLPILAVLAELDEVELAFLSQHTGLSEDRLSTRLQALQEAGFVTIRDVPGHGGERVLATLTNLGRDIFARYWKSLPH